MSMIFTVLYDAILVSSAKIKALNLYLESPKLHNSYCVASSRGYHKPEGGEKHNTDSENLEEKEETQAHPRVRGSLRSVLGHKDCGMSVDPHRRKVWGCPVRQGVSAGPGQMLELCLREGGSGEVNSHVSLMHGLSHHDRQATLKDL